MRSARRLGRAWGALHPDQRLAGVAALALLLSMFLPWYQETGNAIVDGRLAAISADKSAFQVYSFVEAAIFLVAIGVLGLLFARGERRAFHLPGGDGLVVMAGGLWVMFLIFYRQIDKPSGRSEGPINTAIGVQWGIFVAFLLGALLAYAGWRIRAARVAAPGGGGGTPAAAPHRAHHRRRHSGGSGSGAPMQGQMSFEETEPAAAPAPVASEWSAGDAPVTIAWEEPPTRRARRRDVFEPPADPDEPAEFDPPRRRRR
jgi:hypothetical protein